jgi:pyruvate formate lyase activating enzyme
MAETTSLRTLLEDNTIPAHRDLVRQEPKGIRCLACGHRCLVRPGRAGTCRVRFNRDGQLRVPGGYVAGVQVDPIEKKPFYHAYPGRDALSFGMLGCDLHCSYCQNWVTSQALRDDQAVSLPRFCTAEKMVELAIERDAPVVVSTYNEPLITSEWAVEVFKIARNRGLTCGFVSNGNGTPEVIAFLRPYVDLYKVDLKSFDDRHYRELGGVLANILDTIERLVAAGFWVEIVTLVIPGFNDGDEELTKIAGFLAGISIDVPWHVTAFHPGYKMQDPGPTPPATLLRAYEIGKSAGLRYVYPGNIHGGVGDLEDTYCPSCGARVINRVGFYVRQNRMKTPGRCPSCDGPIAGVWQENAPVKSQGTGIPMPVLFSY